MAVEVKSIVEDVELVARRRSQLVSAAIKLFCREGFHSTTVKDIARVAGVSAGLVYQYVHDKQDLLFLALSHIVETNKQEIPAALAGVEDPILRLRTAVEAYARVMDANREAVLLTYRESKSLTREYKEVLKSQEIETNKLISTCIEACISEGYMRKTKVELLTYHLVVVAHAWPLKYWRLCRITTLDEYIKVNIHSVWEHLLTEKGLAHYQDVVRRSVPAKRAAARR
jgi:AcrR family transcriptional regulator